MQNSPQMSGMFWQERGQNALPAQEILARFSSFRNIYFAFSKETLWCKTLLSRGACNPEEVRMVRWWMIGMMLSGAVSAMPSLASAQTGATTESAAAEDPNDKMEHERSFEETRKHMQLHSDWSKKSGKMNDK